MPKEQKIEQRNKKCLHGCSTLDCLKYCDEDCKNSNLHERELEKGMREEKWIDLPKQDWEEKFKSIWQTNKENEGKYEKIKSFIFSLIESEKSKSYREGFEVGTNSWKITKKQLEEGYLRLF